MPSSNCSRTNMTRPAASSRQGPARYWRQNDGARAEPGTIFSSPVLSRYGQSGQEGQPSLMFANDGHTRNKRAMSEAGNTARSTRIPITSFQNRNPTRVTPRSGNRSHQGSREGKAGGCANGDGVAKAPCEARSTSWSDGPEPLIPCLPMSPLPDRSMISALLMRAAR